jgi:hypothetical protein
MPYALTASEAATMVPGATFNAGWLMDEASGNLLAAFGGITLVASGAGLLYGLPGPIGDRAVGFTASSTGKFSGGTFNIASNLDELVVAWVGKWSALPSAFGTMFGNASAAFGNGWSVNGNDGTSGISIGAGPASTWGSGIPGSSGYMIGKWHVGIAVIDRSGTDAVRIGVRDLRSSTAFLSAPSGSINGSAAPSASSFSVGSGDWVQGNDHFALAALYVGSGPGVAAGLSANLAAALDSFAAFVESGRYGADKIISYDPPGAIGLIDPAPIVLVRFNETASATYAADEAGTLTDLGPTDIGPGLAGPMATPDVVPGIVGPGRHFNAGTGSGYLARDRVPGTSLLTRDMTIQTIARWVAADQVAYGTPGRMVVRGLGFAVAGAAQTRSFILRFHFNDFAGVALPAGHGRLNWEWELVGGTPFEDVGALFVAPLGFTLFTATRRWVSPTLVMMRYYVGDQLIGQTTTTAGDIGGGTLGAMQIGSSAQVGQYGTTWTGDMDDLLIVDREMSAEEVENTWLRLTRYQPLGTQLLLELHDDGFPMSTDSSSDIRLDTRMIGQGLGLAAAAVENLRANFLPARAYGSTLEQWEQAVAVTPQPLSDIDTRRARVLARLQQRNGVSPTGIAQAIGDLIDTPASNLQYIAFDNTWLDDFATVNLLRWDLTPTGCATAVSGKMRFAPGAGTFTAVTGGWLTAAATVSRSNEFRTYSGEHALAKMSMTTPANLAEMGIWFGNRQRKDYILLGVVNNSGTALVIAETFLNGVSQGNPFVPVSIGSIAGLNVWLHLYQDPGTTTWRAAWSTTSRTAGYTTSAPIAHPGMVHWSGAYFRSSGGGAIGAAVVDVEDFTLRTPDGNRTLAAYVYRNPALGGSPDFAGAESVIQGIRHAYTDVHFVTSLAFRADIDPADNTPMGAL